jgi:hypothetical protein
MLDGEKNTLSPVFYGVLGHTKPNWFMFVVVAAFHLDFFFKAAIGYEQVFYVTHIPNDSTENIQEILYESRANIVKSRVVGHSSLRRKH